MTGNVANKDFDKNRMNVKQRTKKRQRLWQKRIEKYETSAEHSFFNFAYDSRFFKKNFIIDNIIKRI